MALTTQFESSFRSLLAEWNRHQMLRDSGGSISDLAASRARLDAARLDAHRRI